tara:strand:+ start:991 stop:2283 length:1293 start_codon:yes stop_codon:yes gene_type:complete
MKNWIMGSVLSGLLVVALTVGNAHATYQKLDAIVAIVDEDVVLASELMTRLQTVREQMQANQIPIPPNDVLVNQVMERLILENIQSQEAQRRGIEIDDETLTRAVNQFAQNNNMTLPEFQVALAKDGVSYREFREDIRGELVRTRLQRGMINRRVAITEQDVQGLLNSPAYQEMFSDDYRVGHIMLAFDDDASEAVVEQAKQKAATLIKALRDGADFAETAVANSAASSALEGGDLGWRKAGELPSLFTEPVLEMAVGDVAEPIKTGSAFHIIKLLERRGAGTQQEAQTKVRHILVRPSAIRTPADTEALSREIHGRLVNGEDFETLAKEFSEDPGSALNGGDLGWSTPDQFVPIFAEVMEATADEALSEPFLSEFGWHILTVEGRRSQDMSEEARSNMALELLHRRRYEEERQEWLKEIRDEAFVELRI